PCRAGDPQGLPPGDRFLFGVPRKRRQDPDRPDRLFARARPGAGDAVRPGNRFLRVLLGDRRPRSRVRIRNRPRSLARDRYGWLAVARPLRNARRRRQLRLTRLAPIPATTKSPCPGLSRASTS